MKTVLHLVTAIFIIFSVAIGSVGAQTSGRIEAERSFIDAQKALAGGDDVTAERHLMKALQYDKSFTSAIWQLSQIYEKRGKLEYARELLLRGLQQEPNASWARDKLAQMEHILTRKLMNEAESHMATGSYNKALPKLSLYLGIKPHDPAPLILMGRCHLALGNLKTAKEYLLQAVQRDPSNREIASLLDSVDERLSRSAVDSEITVARKILENYTPEDRERARAALEKVLSIDPGNAWATDKLQELEMLAKRAQEPSETAKNIEESRETIDKGIEAIKSMDNPLPRFTSVLKSNVTIVLLVIAVLLLVLNLKKRPRLRSYPLQGSLSLIPILDVVSLLNSNLKTGRLYLTSGKERGEIYLEKGEIIHARYKGSDGKTAFQKLMDFKSGKYIFYNHLPNVRHTISEPLSLLLLSMQPAALASLPPEKQKARRVKALTP